MADLLAQLEALSRGARDAIARAGDEKAVEELRVRFLGKKGELSAVLRGMGQLSAEERPRVGEVANRVKDEVEALLDGARRRLEAAKLEAELAGPPIDVTLPARRLVPRGHRHPITRATEEISAIFARLGYEVASGPEIRARLVQLRGAQHPAGSPRARHAGHLLRGRVHAAPRRAARHGAAPHAHLARADPRDEADRQAAGPDHLPRARLPVRLRPDPLADVPPDRGALRRRGDHLRRPEGDARRVRARLLRAGHEDALPPELLPVRRARRGGGRLLLDLRRQGPHGTGSAAGRARRPAGSRCSARAWSTRRCSRTAASTRSATPGSPSAWASSGMAMLRYGIDDLRLYFENDLRFLEQF